MTHAKFEMISFHSFEWIAQTLKLIDNFIGIFTTFSHKKAV